MKNRAFVNILISVIVWMLILFTLQCLFAGYTKEFGLACSMCFLSIFFLFSYRNALKPTETIGPYNPTKRHYEKRAIYPGISGCARSCSSSAFPYPRSALRRDPRRS